MTICWINGEFIAKESAHISIFDHGLLYGDGVFEGIRFYDNVPFLLDQHLQRLFDSADAVMLRIPFTKEELSQAIHSAVEKFDQPGGYIRLVVTRGEGPLGVDPGLCPQPTVFLIVDNLSLTDPDKTRLGIRTIIASTRRVPNVSWDSRIKSLNYLNNVLGKLEARNAGVDEAILLNQQGNIAEGTVSNVFVVHNNRLLTPLTSDGALAGVTRSIVFQLALDSGIDAEERTLTPYDLYTADECFFTGTGIELIPVREVDGRKIKQCPGAVFTALRDAFATYIHSRSGSIKND